MRSTNWQGNWGRSAEENQDIRFISGWGNRSFQEMLFSINDIADKLELQQGESLLDIGCGAGLFEIAFSHWAGNVYGTDYSEGMVRKARTYTDQYNNVFIQQGNIKHLPFKTGSFDKVLVNSVIQYLDDTQEVNIAMGELTRVTKTGGLIFLSLIPSARTKQQFLEGYYNLGLPEEEVRKKIEINNNILWFDESEMIECLQAQGFKHLTLAKPCDDFQKKYYFDLIIKT